MSDDISQATGTGTGGGLEGASSALAPLEALPLMEPAAVSAPSQPVPPQQAPTKVGADIAKILQDVKLPERRRPASEPKAAATIPIEISSAPSAGVVGAAPLAARPLSQSVEIPGVPSAPQNPPASQSPEVAEERPAGSEPSSAVPAPAEEAGSPVVSLHTMKTDLQDIVREQKMSAVRAASMEADRQNARQAAHPTTPPAPGPARGTLLMLASAIVLFGLGGAAIFGVYIVMYPRAPLPTPASSALLFAENRVTLQITNQSSVILKQTLGGMLAQAPGSIGSITQIAPETLETNPQTTQALQRPATLAEFLAALGAHPPDDLLRALSNDFFFGIHAADVPAPLFVIPVSSYERAFAGMLTWEDTIDGDLQPLFKEVAKVAAGMEGFPVDRQFVDLVVRNYDARALKDDSGAAVLYYSFPTQKLLIIAASPYTFPEVLSRLQAERKL